MFGTSAIVDQTVYYCASLSGPWAVAGLVLAVLDPGPTNDVLLYKLYISSDLKMTTLCIFP